MSKKKEKVRTAIYIDKDILKRCDECIPLANVRSRNEFIAEALRYYIGANFSQELENYTLQSVSQVIVNNLEKRSTGHHQKSGRSARIYANIF